VASAGASRARVFVVFRRAPPTLDSLRARGGGSPGLSG
jgi:hypothetical protein